MSGSQKVMCLAVFLELPGVGEVGTVRASMCDHAARLGTLNSYISRCSDVRYENRIWEKGAPLDTQNWVGYDLGSIAWLPQQ